MFAIFLLLLSISRALANVTFQDTSSLGWDPEVKQFSGYIDVDEDENSLFYWFFESRNDPKTDPLIVFLNGGPGCSSMKSLWLNAPGIIQADLSHVNNPYSWNSNASIIFVDQPAGTGLSTVNRDVTTTRAIGQQTYEFLNFFFEAFPIYRDLDVHLIGLSDAGYFIGDVASEILNHNERLFNLTSVVISNGLINTQLQYQYIQPMICGAGDISPVLSDKTCAQMDLDTPLCADKIYRCNSMGYNCSGALEFCNAVTIDKYPGNYFNLKKPCANITSECYPQDVYYEEYMNLPYVQTALGAQKSSFIACNATIAKNLEASGSKLAGDHHLEEILHDGIPLLMVAGDLDGTYNWLGNRAVAITIPWNGQEDYSFSKPSNLVFNGNIIGEATNHDHLSFVRLFQAGHLVAHDKPQETLQLINTWMLGDYSFSSLREASNIST